MSGFENKIMKQIINKLGYEDEPGLFEKSTELIRLLDLKSSKIVSSIGDYAKTLICIDLAATQLGYVVIDMDIALKISGLRKTAYINNKRIIEKLLDLSEPIGIKEICTKLNINECQTKAIELLNLFKIKMENCNTNDIDLTHPQYSAMAIYQASKLLNKKLSKTKIQKFSNLKLLQWNKLEQQWNKIIEMKNDQKTIKRDDDCDKNANDDNKNLKNENHTNDKNTILKNENNDDEIEDYEIWKRRMIIFAQFQLGTTLNNH